MTVVPEPFSLKLSLYPPNAVRISVPLHLARSITTELARCNAAKSPYSPLIVILLIKGDVGKMVIVCLANTGRSTSTKNCFVPIFITTYQVILHYFWLNLSLDAGTINWDLNARCVICE